MGWCPCCCRLNVWLWGHQGGRGAGVVLGETTVGTHPAVLPSITGRAWVTGTSQFRLDPTDPFPAGFLL